MGHEVETTVVLLTLLRIRKSCHGAASGLKSAGSMAGSGIMGSLAAKRKQVNDLTAPNVVSVKEETE